MTIVLEEEWDDEMKDPGYSLQLDQEDQEDPKPYFDEIELERDYHERMCHCYESQIQDMTVPGWGFLFFMDENATEEQVAELEEIECKHFTKYDTELSLLKRKRDYHLEEWKALQ